MFCRPLSVAVLALTSAMLTSTNADAAFDYGFHSITNTNSTNVATGEAQSNLRVIDAGGGRVQFLFSNSGPQASAITDVYFDDSQDRMFSSTITSFQEPSGVDFFQSGVRSISGGNSIGFTTTTLAKATSLTKGINPGENLGLTLTLASGFIFDNVVTALQTSALRIGIQIKGFSNSGRESFVNDPGTPPPPPSPPPVVPEPSGIVLASLAAAGLFLKKRNRAAATDRDTQH